MDRPINLDLSILSTAELIEFLFDRPILDDYGDRAKAYYGGYHTCDASKPGDLLASVTSIFENASLICPRFSNGQFAQGINELICPGDIEIERYLFSPDVHVPIRTACVRSIYHFYADVVPMWPEGAMPEIFYMLWHAINTFATNRLNSEGAKFNEENRVVLDAIFETLQKILEIPDQFCHHCALHGLGHLPHMGVAPLLQKFIDDHRPEFSESGLVWMEQCRDGTVMEHANQTTSSTSSQEHTG